MANVQQNISSNNDLNNILSTHGKISDNLYVQGTLKGLPAPINLKYITRVTKSLPVRVAGANFVLPTVGPDLCFEHSEINTPEPTSDDKILVCSSGKSGYLSYICPDCGAVVSKLIGCNKEYCPECGAKWGVLHQQRYFRGKNSVEYMFLINKTLGYWVITLPEQYRAVFSDNKKLDALQVYVKRYFKETLNYTCGVTMYHWCGEDGKTFKPHLNVLVPSGYLTLEKISDIRKHISSEINKIAGTALPSSAPSLVINYNYTNVYKKALHKWRYVCRPTWRVYSDYINNIVFNYRNQRFWGIDKSKLKENAVEKVNKLRCPLCDGQLHYSKALGFVKTINKNDYIHIGGGIYLWRKYMDINNPWILSNYL